MSQIIGGHTFVPLEKNIDDVKLNAITGGATITAELISTQTLTTSAVTNDQFLVLKAAGTLARILYDDLATSLGSASGMVGAITSVRLRSFNAIGNPSFEVDQVNVNTALNLGLNTKICDRWYGNKNAATAVIAAQANNNNNSDVPGTNYRISTTSLNIGVSTPQATLAAGEYLFVNQVLEGSQIREIIDDVFSVSLLISATVAPITLSVSLTDPTATQSFVKHVTIPTTNPTLITIPNIPAIPVGASGNTFSSRPGVAGMQIRIALGCGTTYQGGSSGVWSAGNFLSLSGFPNNVATVVTVLFRFIQIEPGALCTTLIDKPFAANYDECLRYYFKTLGYSTAIGTATQAGANATFRAFAVSGMNGYGVFAKRLAKVPTVNIYGPNGVLNNVSDNLTGTAVAVTGTAAATVSDQSFLQIAASGNTLTASNTYVCHYTAETGW